MSKEEIIQKQKEERNQILANILASNLTKKLIVAGAGTGKTFTFSQVLNNSEDGKNIAMTFIRLLRNDMEATFGSKAEVRTFHEFCKKILHEKRGGFIMFPNLTTVIEEDAKYLEYSHGDFNEKFQTLDEDGNDLKFYLERGDYYNAVAFNDSVYRMLKELQKNLDILDQYDLILIDEYQDFNYLEVAFINELEKKGNILIVGDDDQAVYDSRYSSATHLRNKYGSGEYEIFELPFCTRCTEAIVQATNSILKIAEENDSLRGRISKRYECFIEAKDKDNQKYPQITTAHLTKVSVFADFIKKQIAKISVDEINESWEEGKEYPTILIVGPGHYQKIIYKELMEEFPNIEIKQAQQDILSITDGYKLLLEDINSNLGWRIIISFLLSDTTVKPIVKESQNRKSIISLLKPGFVETQKEIIDIISKLRSDENSKETLLLKLEGLVSEEIYQQIVDKFLLKEEPEISKDKSKPSIMFTTFVGCKGLSAGFVFIVGANDGDFPKNPGDVSDSEICQFVVALTRTRKKCFILSTKWLNSPKDKNGNWINKKERTSFINLIPKEVLEDLGEMNAAAVKKSK